MVALERAENNRHGQARFICRCDCGVIKTLPAYYLTCGDTTSCGCARRDMMQKHGLSRHPLGSTWRKLVRRCTDATNPGWHNYGARGITVCPQWLGEGGFKQFILDMGERPPGHTIERIDNDGPYRPDNCRWATNSEQQRNTRRTLFIEHNGLRLCVTDWAKKTGLSRSAISERFKKGRPINEVLGLPSPTRPDIAISGGDIDGKQRVGEQIDRGGAGHIHTPCAGRHIE
jgi:hypothetical protein